MKTTEENNQMVTELRKRFEVYSDEELQIFNGENEETLKNWNREDSIELAIITTLDEISENELNRFICGSCGDHVNEVAFNEDKDIDECNNCKS